MPRRAPLVSKAPRAPTALRGLQGQFQQHVLGGDSLFAARVADTAAADAARRLAVYHDAYRLRLIEVLEGDFPGVRAIAGEVPFDALARDCINASPSQHFNARWYGGALVRQLAQAATPALAEMARLEWALAAVFDAPDQPTATLQAMARLAPEDWSRVQVRLQDALQLLPMTCNTVAIRRAVDREEPVPDSAALDAPHCVAVWRKEHTVYYRVMETDEAALIAAVQQGATFAALCERLCEWHAADAVALRAAGLLKQWLLDHWVRRIVLEPLA